MPKKPVKQNRLNPKAVVHGLMRGLENILGKAKARDHIEELTKQVHESSELYKKHPKQITKELNEMMGKNKNKELER